MVVTLLLPPTSLYVSGVPFHWGEEGEARVLPEGSPRDLN